MNKPLTLVMKEVFYTSLAKNAQNTDCRKSEESTNRRSYAKFESGIEKLTKTVEEVEKKMEP